ncbi:MAG: glycosyl hydrolase family 5, partial [Bacteroidota bacterium]
PSNIVEMTGLGEQHIVNCYTTGHDDGVPGLHPGHTPYNNLQPWGGSHNGSNPRWFTERGYPDWDEGGWPFQEAHFNCRYSWANGEFTPRQTMRGKMVLYGYLYGLSKE